MGTRERGKRYLSQRGTKDGEGTDIDHRKWQFIRETWRTCIRMRCLILIAHVNYLSQSGLLMAGLPALILDLGSEERRDLGG